MNDVHNPSGDGWDHTEPIDMTEVHADDQFLDSLAADRPVPTRDAAEYQLAELLSSWRHEVVAAPAPDMPTIDDVEAAIAATERARRSRGVARHLRIISGAAAVVIVAGAGLTVLAEGSSPGDPLWGVKRVVFAEEATQTQASMDVQANLEKAEAAVAAGDMSKAAALIASAQNDLQPVRDTETRNRMNEWMKRLAADAGTSLPPTSASTSATDTTSAGTPLTPPAVTGPATPPRDLQRSGGDNTSTTVTVSPQPQPGGGDQGTGTGNPGTTEQTPPPVTNQTVPQPEPPATTTTIPPVEPATTVVPEPTTVPTVPTTQPLPPVQTQPTVPLPTTTTELWPWWYAPFH
ncbi:anti-sigma-D factor RsdA [Gordonia sp. NPDC003424]